MNSKISPQPNPRSNDSTKEPDEDFSHYFSPRRQASFNASVLPATSMKCVGVELQMATGAGVFARAGLDAGSRLLIETFVAQAPLEGFRHIGDLGCGWGGIGCFVAAKCPDAQMSMIDINLRAVEIARANLQRNNIGNPAVWCGDGLTAARAKYFEAILCNPPVRAGNSVIERLFSDAQRCLQKNGQLWIVLRTQQGAKSWQKRLAQQFGNCETIAMESGYRVLKSQQN